MAGNALLFALLAAAALLGISDPLLARLLACLLYTSTTAIRRVAVVNEAVCQGCGACTVACLSGAMDLRGFMNKQIIAEVDAICK